MSVASSISKPSPISSRYARRIAAGSRVEKPHFTRCLEIMVNWLYPALQTASRLICPPMPALSSG
jgi:hypothetical protein